MYAYARRYKLTIKVGQSSNKIFEQSTFIWYNKLINSNEQVYDTLTLLSQFIYKFKKKNKKCRKKLQRNIRVKIERKSGWRKVVTLGFAISQDTRVVYKIAAGYKLLTGFAMMTRGQQFHPSAKLSPLDLERRKLSRRITVFPRFLSSLSTLMVQKHSTRFFNGNFTLPLQRSLLYPPAW